MRQLIPFTEIGVITYNKKRFSPHPSLAAYIYVNDAIENTL